MRMSRWAWLSQFFRVPTPTTKAKREKREPKEPRVWLVMGRKFLAHTKSEARALAKEAFGFKGRLPAGTVVREERKAGTA